MKTTMKERERAHKNFLLRELNLTIKSLLILDGFVLKEMDCGTDGAEVADGAAQMALARISRLINVVKARPASPPRPASRESCALTGDE